ncbi:hypothetical protein MRB53_041298 [Persea americana]|nr:hypothetical protein MRB53_041298 [Persea americana]
MRESHVPDQGHPSLATADGRIGKCRRDTAPVRLVSPVYRRTGRFPSRLHGNSQEDYKEIPIDRYPSIYSISIPDPCLPLSLAMPTLPRGCDFASAPVTLASFTGTPGRSQVQMQ